MSIRLRLTLWFSLVLLLGLALFSSSAWFLLERRLMQGVDARLSGRLDGLRNLLNTEIVDTGGDLSLMREELGEFARSTPEGALLQARDAKGTALLPVNAIFTQEDWRPGTHRFERNGIRYQVTVMRSSTFELAAATSLEDVETILGELRSLLLWIFPINLAVAILGGSWISRRALAPVDRMTHAVKSISVQNLSQRLEAPQTGDELQHLAETWNEVLERLETAIQRVRQFTADASHELRTPLSLIHSTADLALRRERPAEDYRQALQQIKDEAQTMAGLTESLLLLARADARQIEMPLAPTDLARVVGDVVKGSVAFGEARGVQLSARVEGRPIAPANEEGIRRLLLILIDNAVKHTPPGGVVNVSAIPDHTGVLLEVRDNGSGIPDGALPHVFERFYRADPSHQGEGAGLGLAIAQVIAQAHGAEIAVESQQGKGARFSIMLKPLVAVLLCAVAVMASEKKIQKKDLPPAVAAAMETQTKGSEIVGYSKETENGKTEYEVETKVNGRTRDLLFDSKGALMLVEEETPIDKIPAAAKAAIEKKAAGGKIDLVETLTKGNTVKYEGHITSKSGKKSEYLVDAEGKPTKE